MARARKKKSLADLAAQPDPKAPLDSQAFLAAAKPVLDTLTKDLLMRADNSRGITRALRARHAFEQEQQLTADKYEIWRRNIVIQIAAGWLLSCVFVRTLEDRGLLPTNRIAGPGATDAQQLFFQLAPYLTERDYLRAVFTELEHVPATHDLFDRDHNLTWRLAPSAEATRELLGLFRSPDPANPAFRFGQSSTRFLGDLYQDLSEDVRKRYALLQTPDFIESFILDRTLEPAIEEFGLTETTLIDPTCGSGHFLLGAFERLFEKWCTAEPGKPTESAVEKALTSIHGVDINPYAVSIAKFRLTLAALEKLGAPTLQTLPKLPLNVVVADSLADGTFADLPEISASDWGFAFNFADERAAKKILRQSYAAVVGNPPYITVKDKALRERYRAMYESAGGKYALSAPFMERFFHLARPEGFVGQITANSFMKREFGKGLVERVLPKEDLQLIINTAGAYIPGHGTPTVLIFGRHRAPSSAKVNAILARRGEPTTPDNPAEGQVWSSIRDHWSDLAYENDYITVDTVERGKLGQHPWSLEGGGAAELKALLEERADRRLGDFATAIGFMAITGEDEVFARPREAWSRLGAEREWIHDFGIGEEIRDWACSSSLTVFFPYRDASLRPPEEYPRIARALWPFRRLLLNRPDFGGKKYIDVGRPWYSLHQVPLDRLKVPLSIAFAFVATHNHFVLDRGGKVFKQTAPIIKLPETATEDDHLALLAYLNSSTACFWMKQVAQQRTITTGEKILQADPAKLAYEFTGTHLQSLPVPALRHRAELVALAREIDATCRLRAQLPQKVLELVLAGSEPTSELRSATESDRRLLARACLLQEVIDILVYDEFSLLTTTPKNLRSLVGAVVDSATAGIDSDRRAFCGGERADLPACATWLHPLLSETSVRAIEDPAFKRRWLGTQGRFQAEGAALNDQVRDQARARLLERIEAEFSEPRPLSRQRLLATLEADPTARTLAELSDVSLAQLARKLPDSVPFQNAFTLTRSGSEKYKHWITTWDAQRAEDDGRAPSASAPVPPRFDIKDYTLGDFYRLRGKLNVPKERFILYTGCESDQDNEPVYGWAGWDHASRAQALASLYVERKAEEGWPTERLTPMLAGILELLPWLKQWHNEPHPDYGQGLGDFFDHWLSEECREHKLTYEDLRNWRPDGRASGTNRRKRPEKSPIPRPKTPRLARAKAGQKKAPA